MTERARIIRNRLLAGFLVLVVLNVALAAANELLPSGRIDGDDGSSFVTAPAGTAAWFELLTRTDRRPERLTSEIKPGTLDLDDTLVMIDVAFTDPSTVETIAGFVEDGGRLVATSPIGREGDLAATLLENLDINLTEDSGDRFSPPGESPATNGVSIVTTEGRQSWTTERPNQRLLTDAEGRALAITLVRGSGSVVLVADTSVFSNALLAEADNAAFAVAVLGGRQAVFDEYSHGYIDDLVVEPLLPRSWRWTLYLVATATVIFLVAIGKRLGPPERSSRPLPPPRRWFVESLATTLGRTNVGEATDPLRKAASARLAHRTGLAPDATLEELVNAGANLGISGADVRALWQPAEDDESAMAIARVMALAHGTHHPPETVPAANVPPESTQEARE